MLEQLKTASYPLVYIASHFNFTLNGENENFLLMGDESKLTLKEIREADHLFKNVEMLVPSYASPYYWGPFVMLGNWR